MTDPASLPRAAAQSSNAAASAETPSQHAFNYRAFAALFLGAMALATGGFFLRHSALLPTASGFYRVALACPVFFLLHRWLGRQPLAPCQPSFSASLRAIPYQLLLPGLVFSANLTLYHWSMRLTSLVNANLLANLAPVFVVLGASVFLGQRFSRRFIASMLLALTGAVVLIAGRLDFASLSWTGNLLGLASAVFYGLYLLLLHRIGASHGALEIMAWSSLGTSLVMLPLALLRGEPLLPQNLHGLAMLLGLALVSHVAGQGLVAYALTRLSAALSSVTLLVQAVMAALLGYLAFGETLSLEQYLGGAMIVLGIITAKKHA